MDQEKVFRVERFDPAARYPVAAEADLTWRHAHEAPMRLSGFPWFALDRVYRRLPLRPVAKLPVSVDGLANCTAGGQAAFTTDSTSLAIRVKLAAPPSAWNITPVGQCGFDCYVREPGLPRRMRFASSARVVVGSDTYCSWLYECLDRTARVVTLNFPLYQGVKSVELGFDRNATLSVPPPFARPGPVIVYGTSITQGSSASRPGMVYTNILSRALNLEFINLGFSGSALCEPEVAQAIAAMPLSCDPSAIILDCDSNIRDTNLLKQRHPAFTDTLRARWPKVPLLVISKPPFMTETLHPEVVAYRLERRDFLKSQVERRRAAGDAAIYFQDGSEFYGDNWDECTIDQRHTTDLGFQRMAEVLLPRLQKVLS